MKPLLQIDGQGYWMWIAYEPNLDACMIMHLSQEKRQFCLLKVLQTVTQ
jgi:hypothetical protein